MVVKEEKLRDSKIPSHSEALDQLTEIAKQNLSNINHQILLATNQLKLTQENIVKQKNEYDVWKRLEDEKHKNERNTKVNELVAREHAMQKSEENISKRLQDLQAREDRLKGLMDERAKIAEERIDLQKLRIRAESEKQESATRISHADHISSLANKKLAEAEEIKTKYNAFNVEMAAREDKLKKKQEENALVEKNLEELKSIVEPKIKDISFREDNLKKKEEELKSRENEVTRKLAEDKALFDSIQERDKKLKEKEREIKAREEDVQRKILLAERKTK